MKTMKTLTINGVTYTVEDPDSVSYTAQDLTDEQKAQARKNIGATQIDDAKTGEDTWSSQKISDEMGVCISAAEIATADKLCPAFTESGAIVTCEPVEGYPLGVVSQIQPVQEGSGDPYPPGGGKNKLKVTAESKTIDGVEFTVNADGSIRAKGTALYNVYLPVGTTELVSGTSYVLNGCPSGGGSPHYMLYISRDPNTVFDYGDGVNFESNGGANAVLIKIVSGQTLDVVFYPMIRLASETDSTYAPYSNIRPITGHTQVKLTQWEKNLLPLPAKSVTANGGTISCGENGLVTISGTPTGYVQMMSNSFVLPLGELTLSARGNVTNITGVLQIRDVNENVLGSLYIKPDETHTRTFDLSKTANYHHCTFTIARENNNVEMKGSVYYHIGNAAPAEFSMDLGQTVYGGSLDWKTGVLTVDRAIKTLDGTENWEVQASTTEYFQAKLYPGWSLKNKTGLCSHYQMYTGVSVETFSYMRLGKDLTSLWYEGFGGEYSSVDELKAFLAEQYAAGTPVQVCYRLAEPVTVQLTPQQIAALSGVNYLYSDTGDTEVTGRANPAVIIEAQQTTINSILDRVAALEAAAVNNI